MAMSKCVKCDSFTFELKEAEPRNSTKVVYFVQCSMCGGVVGVLPFYDTASLLGQIAERLGVKLR